MSEEVYIIYMIIFSVFLFGYISGFVLFARILPGRNIKPLKEFKKVSVIIPARNEEKNLPHILQSLRNQTMKPFEVIVVDDASSDKTFEVAKRYGVQVIQLSTIPDGWTGKTWAVWNGFIHSTGELLVFLDADVRLAPRALEVLIQTREKSGGAISVVPYHYTEKFYERLAQLPCLLGIFAFTSLFEKNNRQKGLYGSCIVTTRQDYEKINGHNSIHGELLDDLSLGREFIKAGIRVENFIGYDLIHFRMYSYGIKNLVQGFGKGAILSTAVLRPPTVILISLWLVGLLTAEFATPFLIVFGHPLGLPFLAAYLLYTAQIIYFNKWTGRYGMFIPVFHIISSSVFIFIILYSIYMVTFMGYVSWKGRRIILKRGNRD
jgi:4,4'-diaponeurosporenoate glycosyltransferase